MKYKNIDIARFFVESSRLLADKTNNKNEVRDACIVDFINTVSACNFGFEAKDMYEYKDNRNLNDINIISKNSLSFILLKAKDFYFYDVMMSNENCNTPKTHLLWNKHQCNNIENLEFNNRDIIDYIDDFLIHTGNCCGVNIEKYQLHTDNSEIFYNLEKDKEDLIYE